MQLTDEQEIICRHLSPALIIAAFAGTGKTTTLRAYAEKRPNQRMLYLAFNKETQVHANDTFPRHVTARTAHSLAYQAMKVNTTYTHKLGQYAPYQTIYDWLALPPEGLCQKSCVQVWLAVKETIDRFECSADLSIHAYLHQENSPRYLQRSVPPHLLRGCVNTRARSKLRT